MTTETLDKAYLEYSNLTLAKTAKELRLEDQLQKSQQREKVLREEVIKFKNYLEVLLDNPTIDSTVTIRMIQQRDEALEKVEGIK